MRHQKAAAELYHGLSPRLDLDDIRRAAWLKSNYTDHLWLVTDSDDHSKSAQIDFRFRLADGRCLTDVERLYATVKEFAWFARDARFSNIDSAHAHVIAVYQQRAIAHALTLKGIYSYSHLQRADIDGLIQDLRWGMDGLLHASERLAVHLASMECVAGPDAGPSLPVQISSGNGLTDILDLRRCLAQCNLPDSADTLPRVRWLAETAAARLGLVTSVGRTPSASIPTMQNVTQSHLSRAYFALELLFAIRHHAACEVPQLQPFPNGAGRAAKQYGAETKPTPVAPPELVLHLLEQAAVWVAHCSEPILECLTSLRQQSADDDAQATIERCHAALMPHAQKAFGSSVDADGFTNALKMLGTAAWIIIAAFSARRCEESKDLTDRSLRGDDENGWWLYCYISKTTKTWEWIPVPLIVARAVQMLKTLSAEARRRGKTNLFCWLAPKAFGRADVRRIKPQRLLNRFARLVDTPIHNRGNASKPWHWTARQFRRFYAVLYLYRFDGADIAVLSYFLRHFDIETTRRGYLTHDPEVARIWRDAEKDYARRLATRIASGDSEVGGAMGERLKNLAKLIKSRLEKHLFVSVEALGEALHHIMERGGLVITPKAWTTCTCPRTNKAARRARCRLGQTITDDIVGPSYADAGLIVCSKCPWNLEQPSTAGYADRTRSQLEKAVAAPSRAGTLFHELQAARLVELRSIGSSAQVSGDHANG